MKIGFLLVLPLLMYAKSYLISSLPLPKTYIQDLEVYPCDETCLQNYVKRGQIFSFLATVENRTLQSEYLNESKLIYTSLFNLGYETSAKEFKVAMLLPYKKIRRYAYSTVNAVLAYMLTKNRTFELKSYQIDDETPESLQKAFQEIMEDKFTYVIAPVTLKGAQNIVSLSPSLIIHIPTINHSRLESASPNIFFGGIDYNAQIDTLMQYAASPLVVFSDDSSLGHELKEYAVSSYLHVNDNENKKIYNYTVKTNQTNIRSFLKGNRKIEFGSYLLDTPVVKTGMILSQVTLYDNNVTNVLSTQINYNPLILTMTQYRDRKKMIIANSITNSNNILSETNALFGNDIEYDWINYTTTVGADYFYYLSTSDEREYNATIQNNQFMYSIELIKPTYSRFVNYETY